MTDIEIIYIKPKDSKIVYLNREEENFEIIKDNIDLTPQIKIYTDKKPPEQKHTNKKQTNSKNQINTRKTFSCLIIATIMLLSSCIIALNFGYLPVKAFLEPPEPENYIAEVDVNSYMNHYREIKDIPNIDNIKYKIYVTDDNVDTTANNYERKLKDEGYSLEYRGVVNKKGMDFYYYGFIKGITAIGIIMTSDASDIFGHETTILSTIGSVFEYEEIVTWCRSKINIE